MNLRPPAHPLPLLLILGLLLPGCQAKPGMLCQVERVADGDSLDLLCNGQPTRVRLHCIDAPELGQQPWGQKSQAYLRQILPQQVLLKVRDKDRYDRLVVEVFSAQGVAQNYNLAMLAAGQAVVYDHYCDLDEYYAVERQAKDYQLGVWSAPGQQRTPWRWRQRHPR